MRVLHVLPHRGGGGEAYVDMLERLAGFEHERIFLSRGRRPPAAVASLPLQLPRLAARARHAELVHTHGDVASVLARPFLGRRPVVMTTHGLHLLRRVSGPRRTMIERTLAVTLGADRAVICTSESERSELLDVLHARDRDKLRVIHNGVDVPPAADPSARAEARARLEISAEAILGLFVGQLEPRKSPLLAARAAVRVHAAVPAFALAFAGDGPLLDELRSSSGPAVKVLGHRPDVDTLLDAGDLFVQPSEREGLSLALLQAMAHGLAIVASDGSGNPEAVGEAGRLFAAGDEDGLVRAITELSANPVLRASLGAAARRRAESEFSVSRFLTQTEAVYREAVGVMAPVAAGGGPPA